MPKWRGFPNVRTLVGFSRGSRQRVEDGLSQRGGRRVVENAKDQNDEHTKSDLWQRPRVGFGDVIAVVEFPYPIASLARARVDTSR